MGYGRRQYGDSSYGKAEVDKKAKAKATGRQSSTTGRAISNSSKSSAVGSGVTATNLVGAVSFSQTASAVATGQTTSVYAASDSISQKSRARSTGLVAANTVIEAPKIPFNKPRAEVTLTESESGTEHTLISTSDGSDNFLEGDIKIDGSVKSAIDGFTFTLSNPNDRFEYISVNDEIEIKLGYNTPLTTVMRGLVTAADKQMSGDGSVIEIEGADFGQLLQQRVAAEVYLNENIADIVKDLIVKYAPDIDTSAVVDPGRTLESFRLAYESLFDAIKKLADRVDYQFYVDNTKTLHFEPQGFDQTTKTFEQGGIIKSFNTRPNKKKLINEAIIFGGKRDVRERETFNGDGSQTVFQTVYKPHDPDVFVDGNHLQGGAQGTTSLSQADYVYDVDSREFTFANPPSSGTDNIEINYSRSIPIQAIARDSESISEYGLHQEQQTDQNIKKQAEAESVAQSLVDEYNEPPEEASATIVGVHELKAGQSVEFDVPSLGVSSQTYPIVGITYTWGSSGYEIDLQLNEEPKKLADILKTIRDRVKTTQGFDSGVLDLIRKIQDYSDSVSTGDSLDIDSRPVNDSFILGSPSNGVMGEDKLGDRRGTYSDLVDK